MMGLGLVARDKGIRKKGIITITLLNSFFKIFVLNFGFYILALVIRGGGGMAWHQSIIGQLNKWTYCEACFLCAIIIQSSHTI